MSDPQREREAKQWVETVTGHKIRGSLMEGLKDGFILCELLNKIKPGTCTKYKQSTVAFVCRANIEIYVKGCEKLGVPVTDRFETRDLYDGQRPDAVVQNIYAVSAASRKISGFSGPYIGVAYAEANIRDHTNDKKVFGNIHENFAVEQAKKNKGEGVDGYGIIKHSTVTKHSGVQSKWEQGSLAHKGGEGVDGYGIIKHSTVTKHSGVQSKWEQGAIAHNSGEGVDGYGIVKHSTMTKHSGVQSKWEQGSKQTDQSKGHDDYGIVRVPKKPL